MIRAVIATLFANGARPEFVLGLGFVSLPGGLRDRRHGQRPTTEKARHHA